MSICLGNARRHKYLVKNKVSFSFRSIFKQSIKTFRGFVYQHIPSACIVSLSWETHHLQQMTFISKTFFFSGWNTLIFLVLFFFQIPLTHLCLINYSTSFYGQNHFQFNVCLVCFSVLAFITEIPVLNANSLDPNQMLQNPIKAYSALNTGTSVVSDTGLHCLPMSFLWDAGHKWAKI